MEIQTCPDLADLSSLAALDAANILTKAIRDRGRASLALSGGRTPEGLHQALATAKLDWSKVHIFWGDERLTDPTGPDSNLGMARRTLLEPAGIPRANIHPISWNLSPLLAALDYDKQLRNFFGQEVIFDLTVLGMGPDGHVASLFPGRAASQEQERLVIAETQPGQPPILPRVSLAMPVLEASRQLMLLITGQAKLDLFTRARAKAPELVDLPIARLTPRHKFFVYWSP